MKFTKLNININSMKFRLTVLPENYGWNSFDKVGLFLVN